MMLLKVGDGRTGVLMLMGSLGRGGQHTREAQQPGGEQASQAHGTIRSDHCGNLLNKTTDRLSSAAPQDPHPNCCRHSLSFARLS